MWNLSFPGQPAIVMTLKWWEFALAICFWCLLIAPQIIGWVLWGLPEKVFRRLCP